LQITTNKRKTGAEKIEEKEKANATEVLDVLILKRQVTKQKTRINRVSLCILYN
jgi:hypothetical protein